MGSKCYETPPDYFAARWAIHHFNVDAAASDANALLRGHEDHGRQHKDYCLLVEPGGLCHRCQRPIGRYYTEETDGLNPDHYKPGDRVWCNPPFANLEAWVGMFKELAMDGGVMSELLLPASTGTRWFHKHIWNDEGGHWRDGVQASFVGRIQFLLNGQPIRDKAGKVVSSRQENLLVTLKARVS